MRFGCLPGEIKEALKSKENIWIHAVSVGEVLSVKQLIQNIKKAFPRHQIVLSTVTKTGYAMATKDKGAADVVIFAPLDFSFVVRKVLNLINPKIYIVAETELWPNLLTSLNKRNIPIVQVNGRISDKSFQGYKKIHFFFKKEINRISAFCMQSETDHERVIELGADSRKANVVGNIKFDDLPGEGEYRQKCFETEKDTQLLVAGSTHSGEEEILLKVFKSLLNDFPNLRLVIAPRHVERTEEILKIVAQEGFDPIRFSDIENKKFEQGHVIVVDTLGHLKSIYAMATLVFVGKSLTVGGGHNIIEPACFAKPILIGPFMENFRDIVEIFMSNEAIMQVNDQQELLFKLRELLRNPEEMKTIGRLAKQVVEANAGATQKTINIISKFLKKA
ncbi:MAG: 3-deoxy-D-manno-octulosonic acid transferase [Candidatus Omnitrophota bacterium]